MVGIGGTDGRFVLTMGDTQGSRAWRGVDSGVSTLASKSTVASSRSFSEAGPVVLHVSLQRPTEAVESVSELKDLNVRDTGSAGSVQQRLKVRPRLCCWLRPSKWMNVFFTGRHGPLVGLRRPAQLSAKATGPTLVRIPLDMLSCGATLHRE